MGFRDAEWAYGLDLRSGLKVVLVAICHRADDKTHETFVGRRTLASMVGMTERAISKALAELEGLGYLSRAERRRADGYRDTDLITVDRMTHLNEDQGNDDQGNDDQGNDDPISGEPGSDLRGTTFKASSSNELLVSQGSIRDHSLAFERAYAHWPKKVERKKSQQAFVKAAQSRGVEQLTADVIRFGDAYAATEKQFVPALRAWLNGERWTDELPSVGLPTDGEWERFLRAEGAAQTATAGRAVAGRVITSLEASDAHCQAHPEYPIEADGSCTKCERDRADMAAEAAEHGAAA